MTKERIIQAIQEFFSDTSRSQHETWEALCEIRDAAQENIDAMEDDLHHHARVEAYADTTLGRGPEF